MECFVNRKLLGTPFTRARSLALPSPFMRPRRIGPVCGRAVASRCQAKHLALSGRALRIRARDQQPGWTRRALPARSRRGPDSPQRPMHVDERIRRIDSTKRTAVLRLEQRPLGVEHL